MKKHIVCLGDSNTHGYCADPNDCAEGGIRFNESERWTCLLQNALGNDFLVAEEGLNGRTTVFPDHLYEGLDALHYLWPCLKSHEYVSLLIIMLGTNDVLISSRMDITPIVKRMEALLDFLVQNWPDMKQVLLTPPPIDIPEIPEASQKLDALIRTYEDLADQRGIGFIENHSWNIPLAFDGAHFAQQGHPLFAKHLEQALQSFLS